MPEWYGLLGAPPPIRGVCFGFATVYCVDAQAFPFNRPKLWPKAPRDHAAHSIERCFNSLLRKVTLMALVAQFRFGGGFEPQVEKLPQRNLRSLETTAEVAFAQHFGQVLLGAASGAVDGAVVIPPPAGFAVAAEEDADKPAAPAAADDLSDATRQERSSESWNTGGTLPSG